MRQELDNLYTTYIDALAARETVRFTQAGMVAVELAIKRRKERERYGGGAATVGSHRDSSRCARAGDARCRPTIDAKRTLATILSFPPEAGQSLELRGSLRDLVPPPKTTDELVSVALAARPHVSVFRLNVCRVADVKLAKANRFPDVYVLYQPYTYQDNAPFNLPSSRSWALGATVTAPIYDRNQGNIRRAGVNVEQSRLELQAYQRRVVSEVEDAREEYEVSRAMIERIEKHLLPAARHVARSQPEDIGKRGRRRLCVLNRTARLPGPGPPISGWARSPSAGDAEVEYGRGFAEFCRNALHLSWMQAPVPRVVNPTTSHE